MSSTPSASQPRTVFTGARIFDGESLQDGCSIVVEDGWITELTREAIGSDAHVVSLAGRLIAPGFVDIQVNGGGGVLLNQSPTVEGLTRIFEAHRRFGTTAMLPTLISDEFDVMERAAESVRQAIAAGQPGIVGIHFEGPYLNKVRRGVHREQLLRPPDPRAVALFTDARLGRVMVTLAPECVPIEFIRELTASKVIVSIGHTAGDYQTTRIALAAGAACFTHLFNAMTPLSSREPGVVGAALEDPNSYCGIIADGHHVHPATLKLAIAAKTRGRVCLVTDAMPCVGLTDKQFSIFGQDISVEAGRCATAQGVLAGSDLDMAQAVRNCVELLELSLEESLRMASLYPANLLADGTRGRLVPGYRADFCVLDDALQVRASCVAGQFAHH